MNNQATKYEWIINKGNEWNSHAFILLYYLPLAGLLMNLQSRCVWRGDVKVMDTVCLPLQTAVGSHKQNHCVRAECWKVISSCSFSLIYGSYFTFKALSFLPVFCLKLKKLCTCICLYITVTNSSWNIKTVLINGITFKMAKENKLKSSFNRSFGDFMYKVSRIMLF